ncbi:hypothetical protein BJY04DRAFT_182932 [Aspergillus karnatakaensis]|uniref:uncharacterized protein n=1 Tax=Aspergillus karnatakaensis TaxID=1810916 RepID=UPI003CCCBF03
MSAPAPEKKVPSISSTVQPPSQPAPTFQPSASGPLPGAGKLAAPPPPSFTNGAARDAVSAPQSTPLFSSKSIEAQPVAPPTPILHHAELPKPAQPALNVQQVHEIDTSVKAVSEEQVAAEAAQEAERQQAWIASLREAADRRRHTVSTPGSRKRVLEQETPPKSGVKATKVSKAERPKKSLALSSIKPLPKLPILEQIESLTARKPAEKKAEPPKPNNVDEDELLLSAARIAAESMRTGPRILDGYPASSPFEPWRSSFSPGSSAASYTFSRSQSPQQPSMNGYHVALAPDTDLGLGRTLSRTEQRIRMTGGKGLAYKPLNLTPKKSWRTPSKK